MINIIAAMAKNGVIGINGVLPWNIPEDMAFFRNITKEQIVIMGRKTFEGIGFALPDRYNIIVSHNISQSSEILTFAKNLEKALDTAREYANMQKNDMEIFICGGQSIYEQGLEYADRIYLTELDDEYEGDTYFPLFDRSVFKLTESKRSESGRLFFNTYMK